MNNSYYNAKIRTAASDKCKEENTLLSTISKLQHIKVSDRSVRMLLTTYFLTGKLLGMKGSVRHNLYTYALILHYATCFGLFGHHQGIYINYRFATSANVHIRSEL